MTKATELRELASLTTVASGQIQFDSDLKIAGDLITTGNTINITADTLNISDPNITLASGAANSAIADGAGITIDGADATLTYVDSGDKFSFNKSIDTDGLNVDGHTTLNTASTLIANLNYNYSNRGKISTNGIDLYLEATANMALKVNSLTSAYLHGTGDIDFYENNGGSPQVGMHWDFADGRLGIGTDTPDSKLHAFGDGYYQSALTLTREDTSGFTGSVIFEKKKVDGNDNPTPLVTGDRIIQIYSQGYSDTAGQIRYGPEIVADLTADAVPGEALEADTNFISNGNTNFAVHYDGDVTARGAYNTEHVRHSIRPTLNLDFANSKELDSRITFYRDSIATYYDSKGVLRYANTNTPRFDHDPATGESKGLLIEESRKNWGDYTTNIVFNANSTLNAIIYDNAAVAPDGTFSATRVLADSSSSGNLEHGMNIGRGQASTIISGKTYSMSAYLKADDTNGVGVLRFYTGFWGFATFNLVTGQIAFADSRTTATINYVGNGWYRCTATQQATADYNAVVWQIMCGPENGTGFVFDASQGAYGVYVWGVQFEKDVGFPTSYVPSDTRFTSRSSEATYYDETGILRTAPANSPRYGYKYDGRKWVDTGLILENASTNTFTYGSYPDIGNSNSTYQWLTQLSKTSGSVTYYTGTTAPDGSNNAVGFNADAGRLVTQEYLGWYSTLKGSPNTFSIWIKCDSGSGSLSMWNGVGGGTTYSKTFSANGRWTRYEVSGTVVNNNDISVVVTSSNTTLYIWGGQMEQGTSAASSYIHTNGSSITRSADIASSSAYTRGTDYAKIYNIDFYNYSEGTLYGKYTPKTTNSWRTVARIGASTDTNALYLRINPGDAKEWQTYANGSLQANIEAPVNAYTDRTEAVGVGAYRENDFATAWDGVLIGTDVDAEVPYKVSEMNIGADFNGLNNINGTIKKIAYYPERLSNAELQALTENN